MGLVRIARSFMKVLRKDEVARDLCLVYQRSRPALRPKLKKIFTASSRSLPHPSRDHSYPAIITSVTIG